MDRKVILITTILYLAAQTAAEVAYENSADICSRCSCILSNITKTLTLNCAEKGFSKTLSQWPEHQSKLVATFSYNKIGTLEPLPGSDAEIKINFDHCGVKSLGTGLFESTVNVTYVDLSYNLLQSSEISADVFKGPYNNTMYEPIALKYLNLAYNEIHSLQKDVFEHTPFLEVLNLEGNDFRVLDPVTQLALASVPNIQILNLANNRLTDLTPEAVNHFKSLRELDLSRNELDFVPDTLSFVSESLERLFVDHNPIIELTDATFQGLGHLKELSANNLTKLTYVRGNTFVPAKNLQVLRLSQCLNLREIDREAFGGSHPAISEVYLNENILSNLDPELLPWEQLKVFEINGNQLLCTCELYNITTKLPDAIKADKDGPYCLDSWKLTSTQVYSLKDDVCTDQPTTNRKRAAELYTHFNAIRVSLIIMSTILILAMLMAIFLGWSKYRAYRRTRNYPFVSNVIYNPINTNVAGHF